MKIINAIICICTFLIFNGALLYGYVDDHNKDGIDKKRHNKPTQKVGK